MIFNSFLEGQEEATIDVTDLLGNKYRLGPWMTHEELVEIKPDFDQIEIFNSVSFSWK